MIETMPGGVRKNAYFSDDKRYRYRLERVWNELSADRRFVVIGLNPSTADHIVDDPTIRRCMGFAHRENYRRLTMLNLFPFRATDPKAMKKFYQSINFQDANQYTNVRTIKESIDPRKDLVVAAWGVHGSFCGQDWIMRLLLHSMGIRLHTFGPLTKHGHPKHPLYLPLNTPIVEWPYDHR